VTPQVLLTDAEERSVLAASRGLASAGYRVGAVAASRPAVTHWSRRCSTNLVAPDPRTSAEAFTSRLEDILRADDYALLMPGTEASLLVISAARQRLERYTQLRLPPEAAVARSVDKVVLLAEAERAGLPAPETFTCRSVAEAQAAAATLGYPVIVKPSRSFVEVAGKLEHRSAVVVTSAVGLDGLVARLEVPFLVQRFLGDRPILSCSGVRADGELRALAVARYVRTWPPVAGPSSFSETIPPPAGLTSRIESLLDGFPWDGIFQLQLLALDEGRFATLDLNPRLFGSLALPIGAGANLPAVWCDFVLSRRVGARVEARAGFRYRWEEGELRHLLRELRHGHLGAAVAVAAPRRRVVHAYYERTDPGPIAAWTVGLLGRLSRRAKR
jgi:predicted ATP-grasp superfamily ATP-dependent carboligase